MRPGLCGRLRCDLRTSPPIAGRAARSR